MYGDSSGNVCRIPPEIEVSFLVVFCKLLLPLTQQSASNSLWIYSNLALTFSRHGKTTSLFLQERGTSCQHLQTTVPPCFPWNCFIPFFMTNTYVKWVTFFNERFHSLSLTVSSFQGRVRGRCACARREVKSRSACILEKHRLPFVKPANNGERCPQWACGSSCLSWSGLEAHGWTNKDRQKAILWACSP